MKKLIATILCFALLTGCVDSTVPESNSSQSNSAVTQIPLLPSEKAIEGEAPLLVKDLLYRLMKGGILYHNWTDPRQLYATYMLQFYRYNEVADNYDRLVQQHGTVTFCNKEYLAIPAVVYETYMQNCFGASLPVLNQVQEYDSENNAYRINDYFSMLPNYDVTITDCIENSGHLTVKYTSIYYDGKVHHRTMTARQGEKGWQYLTNEFDLTPPQTEPYPAADIESDKLTASAAALAEHMVEYGPCGNYTLADVEPENIGRLFMTNYIFTFESSKNYNENYPYSNLVKYFDDKGGDIVYHLNQAQMIAYQLYGFESWFVPTTGYNSETLTFTNATEVGWGFGPVVRDIKADYISDSKIKVDISAENVEAEEKYNISVIFDVMTEKDCTFLRFNEMTMEYM